MKKTCVLAISIIVLLSLTFCIIPINAAIIPKIIPGDSNPPPPPWEGTPRDPITFYAEISDPSEIFIDDPPFVWTWTFSKPPLPDKTWSTDDEYPGQPYYGTSWEWDYHLFDSDNDKGDWEVEIKVTNAVDETITWPYYWPHPEANVHIGFEGNLVCYENPQIWPIWLRPGWYRVYVLGANEGEETCPKHWNTHIYWESDSQPPIADDEYPYDLDPGEPLGNPFPFGNYVIEFQRRDKGEHTIVICLDAYDERYEGLENEGDNCIEVRHNFWW